MNTFYLTTDVVEKLRDFSQENLKIIFIPKLDNGNRWEDYSCDYLVDHWQRKY